MLYTLLCLINGILGDLLYTVHPVLMGFGALLKEPTLAKNLRCRSEIILSTPPDLMSSLRTPFQRTSVHVLRHCSSETSMVSSYPATAGCSMDECRQWPDALPTTIVTFKCFLFTCVLIDREHFFVEVWQSSPGWHATRRRRNCIVRRNHRCERWCNEATGEKVAIFCAGRGWWWCLIGSWWRMMIWKNGDFFHTIGIWIVNSLKQEGQYPARG